MKAFQKGDVAAMIRRHLQSGQTAVDVGAGYGEMTKVMMSCVGETGRVIAIEPDPMKADALQSFQRPNVSVLMVGASNQPGLRRLFRAGTCQASYWHGGEREGKDDDAPLCACDPLDDLVDRADLVKIDAQGSEAHILDGASRLLKQCSVWILELWPHGLATAKRTPVEVLARLRANGLTPHWCDGAVVDDAAMLKQTGANVDHRFWNIYATR